MAGPAISPGGGLAGNAAAQDQAVSPPARLLVVAWTPTDLDKAKSGIEGSRRRVLGCHLKDDRADSVALGLGDDRIHQRPSDAAAAPLGQDPNRQNLDFAGEIGRASCRERV